MAEVWASSDSCRVVLGSCHVTYYSESQAPATCAAGQFLAWLAATLLTVVYVVGDAEEVEAPLRGGGSAVALMSRPQMARSGTKQIGVRHTLGTRRGSRL
eukprot:EG_transcript_23833